MEGITCENIIAILRDRIVSGVLLPDITIAYIQTLFKPFALKLEFMDDIDEIRAMNTFANTLMDEFEEIDDVRSELDGIKTDTVSYQISTQVGAKAVPENNLAMGYSRFCVFGQTVM